MKGQEKHCNTCASSYYQEEKNVNGGKDMVRMQYCSDPRYNSPVYTNHRGRPSLVHRQHHSEKPPSDEGGAVGV